MNLSIVKDKNGNLFLEIPDNLLQQPPVILKDRTDQQTVATLKDSPAAPVDDSEKLKARITELEKTIVELNDSETLQKRMVERAEGWTEDEYRQLGEHLGFATARPLTPQEEVELTEDKELEKKPDPVPISKIVLKYNDSKYEIG